MPSSDDERARGTLVLIIAAAVLAAVGVALLLSGGSGDSPDTPAAPSRLRGPAATQGPAGADSPSGNAPSPAHRAPSAKAARPVPAAMQEAARAFTVAWASHDARPHQDTSYDDASHRAADHATGALAADLRARQGGNAGAQQWLRWQADRTQVSASVLQVSVPDGAPAPARDSGFARVIYKVTERPARGQIRQSEQHLALKLRRDAKGSWRVVGLPDA